MADPELCTVCQDPNELTTSGADVDRGDGWKRYPVHDGCVGELTTMMSGRAQTRVRFPSSEDPAPGSGTTGFGRGMFSR